jgi:hypothetical protein
MSNLTVNLLPFRDYSEHEVLNFFSCNTVTNKGTLVKPVRSWKSTGASDKSTAGPLSLASSSPGNSYSNTITNNFELIGQVEPVVNSNPITNPEIPAAIGILLKDVREFDENGEKLIFNSRKAAEMDVIIKDIQVVPILTRGVILINDIDTTNHSGGGSGGDPDIGDAAYIGSNGRIGTDGLIVIGKFLSRKDENGYCLVKINIS